MLRPKLLPSKTLQIILPYSSFRSNLHPNPSTTPLLQRVLMPYIKISRNLGKVPVTDGHSGYHYRVVTKSLCQRLCPVVSLRKLSSIFLMLWCRQQFQKIALSGYIFFHTRFSHTDYYWNMRQSWDFPTSACVKIRSNGCPLTGLCTRLLCCPRYRTPWWQI